MPKKTSVNDNGNVIGLTSSYTTADGTSHAMADVWLVADKGSAAGVTQQSAIGGEQNLGAQVSGLVQALSSFDNSQSGTVGNASSSITAPLSNPLPVNQTVAVNVSGLVDTLKQFDANGNLIANSVQVSSSLQSGGNGTPLAPNVQDPSKTGFLAS